MTEIPTPPHANIDPTQQGSTEFTLATLTPEQRLRVEQFMDPTRKGDMTLESLDTSLEKQCNDNYRFLNDRGISMAQFAGVLRDAGASCRQAAEERHGNTGWVKRADGGTEQFEHRSFLTGPRGVHPLTGEQIWGQTDNIFALRDVPDAPDYLSLHAGFSDLEIEMAAVGVFNARDELADRPDASCRAEQILERLEATETGQKILQAQGIGVTTPDAPIALLEEPEGPTVAERKITDETQRNIELSRQTGLTIDQLRKRAPKEDVYQWQNYDRTKGGKGKSYRIQIARDDLYTTWVEVTEWPKAPNDYRIGRVSNVPLGIRDDGSQYVVWTQDKPSGRMVRNERPGWDNRPQTGPHETFVQLTPGEAQYEHSNIATAAAEKLAAWEAAKAQKSGGFIVRLLRLGK